MRLGIKLDLRFSRSEKLRELFEGRDILNTLFDLGIRAVEIPIGETTDRKRMADHFAKIIESGLVVSIHPYSEGTKFNPLYFSPTPKDPCRLFHEEIFLLALDAAVLQKQRVIVNLHPAAGPASVPRELQLERSAKFFGWSNRWCEEFAQGVIPVAELQIAPNRDEGLFRIGDTFEELEYINSYSSSGLCWDFGHSFLNHIRYATTPLPPPHLIEKIVHVHCHDALDGVDHMPLLYANSGWEYNLITLRQRGFDGTVILEVPSKNFLKAGGFESVERSVKNLKKVLDQPV
ncbi:TIM barrel protein [Chitinispirillales bacterium ANBcel5]|uniref:sugar phosphate isomerase/epimerase family protein n=1 Tax=Cellulosispirillum alkaliphilum TaxID=3039283 RepID=UPI002A4EEE47|nr:TIM barrel protein [Chitinispirillales bacterium ANBcel5]